jgi:nucleoside-diphosphate-sugar epimerase
MPATRFVVTGASGFVGGHLVRMLEGAQESLRVGASDWRERLAAASFGGAIVLHLAARAHRGGPEAAFAFDNTVKTREIARAAARGGARRFVYLSSIKVNGEESRAGAPFTPTDAPAPLDAYGRSKRDAEAALWEEAREYRMEAVVVRSPLVYGPPAKGHLATLLRACDSAWPLPFASVENRRSFIDVADLCEALLQSAQAGVAAGRTYLVAHRQPVSTRELVSEVRDALGRPRNLYAVPPKLLEALALACGMGATMKRLTRSLEADASCAERDLGWCARVELRDSVRRMAHAWREGR